MSIYWWLIRSILGCWCSLPLSSQGNSGSPLNSRSSRLGSVLAADHGTTKAVLSCPTRAWSSHDAGVRSAMSTHACSCPGCSRIDPEYPCCISSSFSFGTWPHPARPWQASRTITASSAVIIEPQRWCARARGAWWRGIADASWRLGRRIGVGLMIWVGNWGWVRGELGSDLSSLCRVYQLLTW